jgi:hypothetical protein
MIANLASTGRRGYNTIHLPSVEIMHTNYGLKNNPCDKMLLKNRKKWIVMTVPLLPKGNCHSYHFTITNTVIRTSRDGPQRPTKQNRYSEKVYEQRDAAPSQRPWRTSRG